MATRKKKKVVHSKECDGCEVRKGDNGVFTITLMLKNKVCASYSFGEKGLHVFADIFRFYTKD